MRRIDEVMRVLQIDKKARQNRVRFVLLEDVGRSVVRDDVPLAIERADAQVAKARAGLDKAVAVEREARSDAERFDELAAKDQASVQQRDQARLKWEVAKRDITTQRSALVQSQKELAQAELGWKRIIAKEAEVEALVNQHPEVAETAAIGVPSEYTEDEVKVCIVLVAGAQLEAEALITWLAPRMPKFMVPRYVEFVDVLPKTDATFRTQKVKLRADAINANTWDREAAGFDIERR